MAAFRCRRSPFREGLEQHQEHEINLTQAGTARYHLADGSVLTLRPGDILLLPAGVPHAIEVSSRHDMVLLHVHPDAGTGPDLPRQVRAGQLAWEAPTGPRIVRDVQAGLALNHLAGEVLAELGQEGIASASMLHALAQQALVHFARLLAQGPATRDDTAGQVLGVQAWIDRRFAQPASIAHLAALADLAPTYFAGRFRELVGIPPMAYLRERRLTHAALLLERTGMPVKAVAAACGFAQDGHFNHLFRRRFGTSPLDWRRQAEGNASRT